MRQDHATIRNFDENLKFTVCTTRRVVDLKRTQFDDLDSTNPEETFSQSNKMNHERCRPLLNFASQLANALKFLFIRKYLVKTMSRQI